MKPVLLKGHSRPLSRVRYNREGDLLFTGSIDSKVCVWFSNTGERLGTYDGHEGSVWDLDINFDTTRLLTGSADRTAKIWDAEKGVILASFKHQSMVRAVAWAVGEKMILTAQDSSFKAQATVFIYNVEDDSSSSDESKDDGPEPVRRMFEPGMRKITGAVWSDLNRKIITSGEDGMLRVWDVETGKQTESVLAHKKSVQDLQWNKDCTMLITASSDMTAKVWDPRTLEVKKTYVSDRPLNSASIAPFKNHIILGGGQDAMDVTTTAAAAGHFEVDFYHLVYEEILGSVKGHFGPVNSVHFSPDGRSFASGGEDGYVRLHHLDDNYFDAPQW